MKAYSARWTSCSAIALALAAMIAAPAAAGLKHQYTFNDGTANDSVGGAHGTIVDAGVPTATFTNGQLDLSGNTGQNSGNAANPQPTEDAYVDLPNLIIQNAAQSGVSGAISLEFWFTISTQRTWQWIGGFAGPLALGGSEGVTNNGAVNYMLVTASSGRNNQGAEISNNVGAGSTDPPLLAPIPGENVLGKTAAAMPAVPVGVQQHIVAVWDKNNTNGGANPGGTQALYLNGVNILPGDPMVNGTNAIRPEFDLNNLKDEDNWLGRSQWGDPVFDGLYNEFNIYDHALTDAEVAAAFARGPVPVPEPVIAASWFAVVAAYALRRRR